jgi:hypothetical protein
MLTGKHVHAPPVSAYILGAPPRYLAPFRPPSLQSMGADPIPQSVLQIFTGDVAMSLTETRRSPAASASDAIVSGGPAVQWIPIVSAQPLAEESPERSQAAWMV